MDKDNRQGRRYKAGRVGFGDEGMKEKYDLPNTIFNTPVTSDEPEEPSVEQTTPAQSNIPEEQEDSFSAHPTPEPESVGFMDLFSESDEDLDAEEDMYHSTSSPLSAADLSECLIEEPDITVRVPPPPPLPEPPSEEKFMPPSKKKIFSIKPFSIFLGVTSLLVAGCAAFFSVRGIALLFAGSIFSVTIMASSLELAKLVSASYLYRYWKRVSIFFRVYMLTAILILIGITSLGIYGFLSDAYETTKTSIANAESKIELLESENNSTRSQITASKSSSETVASSAEETINGYKRIYDDFIAQQNTRVVALTGRRSELDTAVASLEKESGGLFSNKKKRLQELKAAQLEERSSINESLDGIETSNKAEYDKFLNRVSDYKERSEQAVDTLDFSEAYASISTNEVRIEELNTVINNTDIGSFRFISRAMGLPVEQAVHYFIIAIIFIFDPLAVTLVVAYNVSVYRRDDDE